MPAISIPETKIPNNGTSQASSLKRFINTKYIKSPIMPPESTRKSMAAMPITMDAIAANFLNLVLKRDRSDLLRICFKR